MPNQVPDKIKTERSSIIRQISAENKKRYFEQMLGKSQKMLIERISADGIAQGYGENYIPMRLKNKDLEKNTFVNVVVDSIIEKGDNSEVRASQQIR
jgi:threonylcarbamoyladenosine tRNA methylthiotransferase MtaB